MAFAPVKKTKGKVPLKYVKDAKNKKKAEKEIKSTSKKYKKGKLTKAEMNKIVKMRLKNYKNA